MTQKRDDHSPTGAVKYLEDEFDLLWYESGVIRNKGDYLLYRITARYPINRSPIIETFPIDIGCKTCRYTDYDHDYADKLQRNGEMPVW